MARWVPVGHVLIVILFMTGRWLCYLNISFADDSRANSGTVSLRKARKHDLAYLYGLIMHVVALLCWFCLRPFYCSPVKRFRGKKCFSTSSSVQLFLHWWKKRRGVKTLPTKHGFPTGFFLRINILGKFFVLIDLQLKTYNFVVWVYCYSSFKIWAGAFNCNCRRTGASDYM